VSTKGAPGGGAWPRGTELTGKGSLMVRQLGGGEEATLQQRGSSGGRRRGPSGPAADVWSSPGIVDGDAPTGDNGGTGGAHREDGSAAARWPKSSSSRDLRWVGVDERSRGEGA
jgi:hypothetical protein